MSITADQERAYYDSQYSQFLNRPDAELICNRAVIERDLADPAQPVYERRRLYLAILDVLLKQNLPERTVLDYGCGTGDWGLLMASEGARVTCLDLSPAAMMVVDRRAKAGGVANRVRTCARDASDLTCFHDGEFDLVYASAAVHHTLKYPNAFAELIRVIRPGGKLILAETYGNNPLLNLARRLRAKAANEPEDAGEEIILGDREIALLRREFRDVQVRPMNLLAMGKRFFRGRFASPVVRAVVRVMEATDGALLGIAPFLGRYCGEVVVVAQK